MNVLKVLLWRMYLQGFATTYPRCYIYTAVLRFLALSAQSSKYYTERLELFNAQAKFCKSLISSLDTQLNTALSKKLELQREENINRKVIELYYTKLNYQQYIRKIIKKLKRVEKEDKLYKKSSEKIQILLVPALMHQKKATMKILNNSYLKTTTLT